MSETFSDLIDRLRDNLISVMAIFMMVVIPIGYIFFVTNSILPQWQMRNELTTRVATAEDELAQSTQSQQTSVSTLKEQIAAAPDELTSAADFLITGSQADRFLSDLYTYANASNVEIAELQTQSNPNSDTQTLFEVKQYQLRVDGEMEQLVEFLARLKEVSQASYILNNIKITEGAERDSLTMVVLLYTSPHAPQFIVETNQNETIIASSTPMKDNTPVRYAVLPGDTLLSISQQFNVTLPSILAANNLTNNDITPDQELLIPQ